MTRDEFMDIVLCHMTLPLALQTNINSTDTNRLLELGALLWDHTQFVRSEYRTDFFYTSLGFRTIRYIDIGYSEASLDKWAKSAVTATLARATARCKNYYLRNN